MMTKYGCEKKDPFKLVLSLGTVTINRATHHESDAMALYFTGLYYWFQNVHQTVLK